MLNSRFVRISDSHQLLFVHIQKTGGVSVEEILESRLTDLRVHKGTRHPTRHPTLAQILRHEPALVDYWTFSVVRNPWDRMVSWWSMIDRNTQEANAGSDISRERMERRKFWMGVAEYPDFETFVSKGPEEFLRLRRSQFDYLVTPTRRPDWIGRTENFASDARILFERLGLPADTPLPHRNKSTHGSYRDYYTPASRARVAELVNADFEEFGYEF